MEYAFDVIGPSGTFFIVIAETDNKKTFESTLRKYFNKVLFLNVLNEPFFQVGGFRMATDASAVRSWFNEKGVILVDTKKDGKDIKLEQVIYSLSLRFIFLDGRIRN